MLEALSSLLWFVICCAAVLLLAYWFTKHVVGRGSGASLGVPGGTGGMKILAQMSLGKEQRLVAVVAAGRYFLLGVSAGQINCLAEFTEEEAAAWVSQADGSQRQNPSFAEALQTVIKEKWRG